MASIRSLKKDVEYLTSAVIGDSFNCLAFGAGEEAVTEILQETVNSRNLLRLRISAGKNVAKAERRVYYKAISKDLLLSVDQLFTKLCDLVKDNN